MSQPHRNGEVLFGSAWDPTVLDPPAAVESGDSFALRTPQGWRCFFLDLRGTSLCCLPQQLSKVTAVSHFAAPGMARSFWDLRGTPLCWPPQQPSKVATVPHFAAPKGKHDGKAGDRPARQDSEAGGMQAGKCRQARGEQRAEGGERRTGDPTVLSKTRIQPRE
eukprot:8319465-Pyramimonas_sp.AAC.1